MFIIIEYECRLHSISPSIISDSVVDLFNCSAVGSVEGLILIWHCEVRAIIMQGEFKVVVVKNFAGGRQGMKRTHLLLAIHNNYYP